jgi:hypothetical protein
MNSDRGSAVAGLHRSESDSHLPEPLHAVEQMLAWLRHARDDPLAALVERLPGQQCVKLGQG